MRGRGECPKRNDADSPLFIYANWRELGMSYWSEYDRLFLLDEPKQLRVLLNHEYAPSLCKDYLNEAAD